MDNNNNPALQGRTLQERLESIRRKKAAGTWVEPIKGFAPGSSLARGSVLIALRQQANDLETLPSLPSSTDPQTE